MRRPRKTLRKDKRRRLSSTERGYDADWRRVREKHLRLNPYCVVCGELGNEADHILSIAERPDLRLEPSNLRTLCKPHHSRRTVMDQGWHKGKGIRKEAAADGMPTDPNHPWNEDE